MNPLGAVFTPGPWARWAVERLQAPARMAAGATVCDPTAGEGAFVFALADAWVEAGGTVDRSWAQQVTLMERDSGYLENFSRHWKQRWGFGFPESNLWHGDVVTHPPPRRFDLVVGNPPWITYPALDAADQERYRPWFTALGLVGRPSELLLGRSGLDLAALVTARVFTSLLAPGGRAGFFLPLSLFHNQGSPERWRRWQPEEIFDLTGCRPFPGIGTRCGWATFAPDGPSVASIPYWTGGPSAWTRHQAVADDQGAAWRVLSEGPVPDLPQLTLEPWQQPRQGINTGGANQAFHRDHPPEGVDRAYVHPLAGRPGTGKAGRWILVPYDRQGRILDAAEVERSGLAAHWRPWQDRLAARRGALLGAQLAKGRWWALLGVGPYAFAPYKVIWSAYGRSRLDAEVYGPRDDGAVWQADQALQAAIPCRDEADAHRIAGFLNGPDVAAYLASLRSAGTQTWAQPGRFKALWRFAPASGTEAEPSAG